MARRAGRRSGGRAIAAEAPIRRILVPTDFSSTAEQAWATARRLAVGLGAEVVLVHVLVEGSLFSEGPFTGTRVREVYQAARAWAEEHIGQWAETGRAEGLTVKSVLRTGVPYEEILSAVNDEQADLIVMGTHGRSGIDRALLGSVADRLIRLAPCPVLTVRETRAPASR